MSIDEKMEARLRDPKIRNAPVTMGVLAELMPALAAKHIEAAAAHRALVERVAQLEARLTEAEAKSLARYEGVWNPDHDYTRGCFVTDKGALWHCEQDTRDRPGTSDAWRLSVKGGR